MVISGDIKVSPNPVHKTLYVVLPGKMENPQIEVVGMNGQVYTLPVKLNENSAQIDMTGMTEGIYLLRITSGNKVYMQKITVK